MRGVAPLTGGNMSERIKIKVLAEHIREFLTIICPQTAVVYTTDEEIDAGQLDEDGEIIPRYLSVEDTLAIWIQLPDCSYTPMFVGWMVAQDYTLDTFTPSDIDKAVCVALTGKENNVMFDYLGDFDGTKKLN